MRCWKERVFLYIVLLCCDAATGQTTHLVQEGDDVTFSCSYTTPDQVLCTGLKWVFDLNGKFSEVTSDSDGKRLSMTPGCSLHIKEVKTEDARRYYCRKDGRDGPVTSLIVVSLTRVEDQGVVTLTCEVFIHDSPCPKKVQWLFDGAEIPEDHSEVKTWSTACRYAAVRFPSSSNKNSFTCKVSHDNKAHNFVFRSAAPTTQPTTQTTTQPTTQPTETSAMNTSAVSWWMYAVGAAAALTLLVLVVLLVRWRTMTGNQTQTNDLLTSDPASPADLAESHHIPMNPDDELSYTSVTYKKNRNKVRGHADEEVESENSEFVLYASVKKA